MKACQAFFLSCLALASAGCATNRAMPLLFAQSQTLGVSIGGTAQEQGAELTLGYRDSDIAVVPVSVPQAGGTNTQLNASGGCDTDTDAFSVLGQFKAETNAKSAKVGLGKFFATGIAARRLADGFAGKKDGGGAPGPAAPAAPCPALPGAAPEADVAANTPAPRALPLLFAQSHTLGVSLNGTAQEQGVQLTLGFRDRDVAIIPVSVPQGGGTNTQLAATVGVDSDRSTDAFSVLGRFDSTSDATSGQVGLGKFFATGIAARSLADGFSDELANADAPPAAVPAVAAPSTNIPDVSAPGTSGAGTSGALPAHAPAPLSPKVPAPKTPAN